MLLDWYNSNFGKCKRGCNGVSHSPFLVDKFCEVCSQWCKHGTPRKWANHIANHQFRGSQHKYPFDSIVAIDIMLQFAKAMWYFHNRKIAHKDLNSTNVFVLQPKTTKFRSLGRYLYVKLVNFGIFKLYNKIETNGTQSSNKGINIYVYINNEVWRTIESWRQWFEVFSKGWCLEFCYDIRKFSLVNNHSRMNKWIHFLQKSKMKTFDQFYQIVLIISSLHQQLLEVFTSKTFDNICTMLKVPKTMNLWMHCLNNQFMGNITLSGSSNFCIH